MLTFAEEQEPRVVADAGGFKISTFCFFNGLPSVRVFLQLAKYGGRHEPQVRQCDKGTLAAIFGPCGHARRKGVGGEAAGTCDGSVIVGSKWRYGCWHGGCIRR